MPIDDLESDSRAGQGDADSRTASGDLEHSRVLDQLLERLLERSGLALLVGEAGTGKTALLSKLKTDLEAANCLVVLPRHPSTSFDELLKICCDAAGVADGIDDRLGRVHALTEILIERLEQGGTAVVLLDDAQLMAVEVLEDFSRLASIEKDGRKLIQLVMAGRPELVPQICNCAYRPLQDCAMGHHRLESPGQPEAPAAANGDDEAEANETEDAAPPEVGEQSALPTWMGPAEVEDTEFPVEIPDPPAHQEEAPEQAAPHDESPEPPVLQDETPDAPEQQDGIPEARSGQDDAPAQRDDTTERQEAQPAIAPTLEGLVTTVTLMRPKRRLVKRVPIAAGILIGLVLSGLALVWGGLSGSRQTSDEVKPAAEATTAETAGAEATATAAQSQEQRTGKPSTVRIARFRGVGGAVLQVMDSKGTEDRALRLEVKAQLPESIAGEALSIVISDMPDGALLLAGTDNGDGTWSVDPEQLADLTLIPPMDYSGRFQVTIEATLTRAGEADVVTTLPLKVDLAGVADLPGLEVADASTGGSGPIPLDIDATLTDGDGSERLAITVSGLPDGARLTAGHELGDGRWRLRIDQLEALSLIPPPDLSAPAKLMVSATAQEADGDEATTTLPLTIAIGDGSKIARAETRSSKPSAAKTNIATPAAPKPAAATTKQSKAGVAKTGATNPSVVPSGDAEGGFVLQLASFRSAGDASREAARLEKRFNDLLGGAKLEVHPAEYKGSDYFRVRTTPLEGWTKAHDLCAQLKAKRQDCLVFQHGPATGLARVPAGKLTPKDPPPANESKPIALAAAALPTGAAGPTGAEAGANLRVVDFVVAREIVDREPVDVSETFSFADGNVYAFARIANDGEPTEVSFVWFHRNAIYAAVEMTIGASPRWRTWSSAELQPGPWRVQLVGADGLIIAENSFTVE